MKIETLFFFICLCGTAVAMKQTRSSTPGARTPVAASALTISVPAARRRTSAQADVDERQVGVRAACTSSEPSDPAYRLAFAMKQCFDQFVDPQVSDAQRVCIAYNFFDRAMTERNQSVLCEMLGSAIYKPYLDRGLVEGLRKRIEQGEFGPCLDLHLLVLRYLGGW